MLESVKIDLAVIERAVGSRIVREFNKLDLDAVVGKKFVYRIPLSVVFSNNSNLNYGFSVFRCGFLGCAA